MYELIMSIIACALLAMSAIGTDSSSLTSYEILSATSTGLDARVLVVVQQAPDLNRLSLAQQAEWQRLVDMVKSEFRGADERKRAQLSGVALEFLRRHPAVVYRQAFIAVGEESIVRCQHLLVGETLVAWSCRDQATGAILAVVTTASEVGLRELINDLLTSGDEAALRRIEAASKKAKPVTYVELNARRIVVPFVPATPDQVGHEVSAAWADIDDAGARRRLALSLALLEDSCSEGGVSASSLLLLQPPFPRGAVPEPTGELGARVRRVGWPGIPSFFGPPADITAPWMGQRGWQEADLRAGSAAVMVRRLIL